MHSEHSELSMDAEQGLTQAALASYYAAVADSMLPYVVDRPLTLVRRNDTVPHGTIRDERGLLELVNELALEVRAPAARASNLSRPDRLVLALEAGPEVSFREVGRAAKVMRALLHGLDLESFAMTQGRRGLAVLVPLRPEHDWSIVREFGAHVVKTLMAAAPGRYTTVLGAEPARIHLAVVGEPETAVVAPYSTQRLSNAAVALPAFWHELEELEPERLTPAKVLERLRTLPSDPWEGAANLEQRLTRERRSSLATALARVLGSQN